MTPILVSCDLSDAACCLPAAAGGLLRDGLAGEHRGDGLVAGAALEREHVVDRPRRAPARALGSLGGAALMLVVTHGQCDATGIGR